MKSLFILFLSALVLFSFTSELPTVNKKVIEYTQSQKGKKVDRGECWDLARFALDHANAQWTPPYVFGATYNYKKRVILPGDVIQFENVTFKWELGAMSFPHHTAIVMKNEGSGKIIIAHQNFAGSKKVQFTELNLNYHQKGTLDFFHPVAK